jgi:hypothetical protein
LTFLQEITSKPLAYDIDRDLTLSIAYHATVQGPLGCSHRPAFH